MSHLPLCYSIEDANKQRAEVWEQFKNAPIMQQMKDVRWHDEHHGVTMRAEVEVDGVPTVKWQMTVGLQVILPELVGDKEEVSVEEATRPSDNEPMDNICVGGQKVKSLFEARVDVPLDLEFTIMMHRDRVVPPKRDQNPQLHMMTSSTTPCVTTDSPEQLVAEWLRPGPHWGTMVDPLDGQAPKKIRVKPTPTLILP